MTSTTDTKSLVREFFDRLNERDLGVFDDLCADGFSVDIALKGTDDVAVGIDEVKAMYEEYYTAFPDFRHDLDAIVAEGDLVAVFLTTRGTHEGEFRGVRPTGNAIEIEDTGLIRFADGRIVDLRPLSDMLGLFEQLGVGLDL